MVETPSGILSPVEEARRKREEEVRAAIEARFSEPYRKRMMEPAFREASLLPTEPEGPAGYARSAGMRLIDMLGGSNEGQRRMGDLAANVMNLTPFQAAYDAGKSGQKGDYGMAALYGVGAALPTAVDAYRLAKTAPRAAGIEALPFDPSRRAMITMGESRKAEPPPSAEGVDFKDVNEVPSKGIEDLLNKPMDRREFNKAAAKTAAAATAAGLGGKAAYRAGTKALEKTAVFGEREAADFVAQRLSEPLKDPRILSLIERNPTDKPPTIFEMMDDNSRVAYDVRFGDRARNSDAYEQLQEFRKATENNLKEELEKRFGRALTESEMNALVRGPILREDAIQAVSETFIRSHGGKRVLSYEMEMLEPGVFNVLEKTTGVPIPPKISEIRRIINDKELFNGERFMIHSINDRAGAEVVNAPALEQLKTKQFPRDPMGRRSVLKVYEDSVEEFRKILNQELDLLEEANKRKSLGDRDKLTASQVELLDTYGVGEF